MTKWIDVRKQTPPITKNNQEKLYVLAIDAKGRMSIGYAREHSSGFTWVFAKPISMPAHWMPLPQPPIL